jgi:hypothetical protein
MHRRERSVWLAGMGIAAIAAAWMLHRSLQERDLRGGLEYEGSFGHPARLLGILRPWPRLRWPHLQRGA